MVIRSDRLIKVAHTKRRRETSKLALDKVPVSMTLSLAEITLTVQPSSEEARELHELMLEVIDKNVTEIAGQKLVPMKETEVSSVQLMFPQDRNLHGKVFGGILMRMVRWKSVT